MAAAVRFRPMRRLSILFVATWVATACAVGLIAGPSQARALHARHNAGARHARLTRRPLRMPNTTAAFDQGDQWTLAPARAFSTDRPLVAFNYQIAHGGPMGSVGFQRPASGLWPTPQPDRGLAASLHLDRPQPIVGAKLSFSLR